MSTDVVVDMRSLANAIAGEHRAAESAFESGMREALAHALAAGRLLGEAKAALAHGEWLPWLADSVPFSARRAQEYMQLAETPDLADARLPAHLTIDQALRQVRRPRPAPVEPVADVAGALRGLVDTLGRGNDTMGELSDRLGEARERLTDRAVGWSAAQRHKHDRALALVDEARGDASGAISPGLSTYAAGEILRSSAVKARQAAAMLDELAFSFER